MAARLIPCLFLVLLGGCSDSAPEVPLGADADEHGHTAALAATADANRAALDALPLADRSDEDDVRRGLLRAEPRVRVEDADGMVIWDSAAYAYIDGEAPDTVHPSLWRQETLNNVHGLFELADGVYQVRGYDLANMMLIAGETGWIVVDPLTAAETARAAMALVEAEFGPRPVSAVIFSHSHVDHFGGALGVVSPEDAAGIDVVAPAGFLEAATSENVLAGAAMTRRAAFMYGMRLAHGPRGHVGSGLGKAPARGTISVLPPTITIDRTPQPLMIDGVEFIFQNAPNTEAPAELVFYLPKQRLLAISELVMHTQHNLYTLRGAPVRDASAWSGAIDEAMRLFPDAEVLAPAHHWPTWGAEAIREQLALQRDLYRFIHDQTLRLANQGLTAGEIAETLELPESLAQAWPNRGYYGTVRHNARAVYQRYLGWYDGNPANLDPLPPAEEAVRYVAALGGRDAVLARAEEAVAAGELRWAATLLNHAVFASPNDGEARGRLADVYDQLGYRAESGPWRDVYLSAAFELRHGVGKPVVDFARATGMLGHLETPRFFDAMAVRLDGLAAAESDFVGNFVFTDTGETIVVRLINGVLHHEAGEAAAAADVTVNLTKALLLRMTTGQAGLGDLIMGDELSVDGSRLALLGFFRLLDRPVANFPIVTP